MDQTKKRPAAGQTAGQGADVCLEGDNRKYTGDQRDLQRDQQHAPALDAATHLAALRSVEAQLDDQPGGGWLARAIVEKLEAELAAKAAAQRTVSVEIAILLTSGLSGPSLAAELWHHFPTDRRPDVYTGVVMAVTLFQADLALARLYAAHAAFVSAGQVPGGGS